MPCFVGHILLVAVALVCVILLIKSGFDWAEARRKREIERHARQLLVTGHYTEISTSSIHPQVGRSKLIGR